MESRNASLDIERAKAIHAAIPEVPLVLHGSSGVKHESVVDAIQYGVAKINVATDLNQAFCEALGEGIEKMPKNTDPRKYLSLSRDAVKERVRERSASLAARASSALAAVSSAPSAASSAELGGLRPKPAAWQGP